VIWATATIAPVRRELSKLETIQYRRSSEREDMVGGWGTKKKKKNVTTCTLKIMMDVSTSMSVCNMITIALVCVCSLYNPQQRRAPDC
jgi:hypothetical protein